MVLTTEEDADGGESFQGVERMLEAAHMAKAVVDPRWADEAGHE